MLTNIWSIPLTLTAQKPLSTLQQKIAIKVVTVGLHNSPKAAGYKLYNAKVDHLTESGLDDIRKTLTASYLKNVSHSGADVVVA